MAQRHIMKVELSAEAKKRTEQLGDHNGMTQVSMMSRLVEWFAAQPAAIQEGIVGPNAKANNAALARSIIKHMAGSR